MLPIVIMLLEHGANPLLRQNDGRNTLDLIGSRCIQSDPQLQLAGTLPPSYFCNIFQARLPLPPLYFCNILPSQSHAQLPFAVDDAILRLDSRWGGADAADAAAATAANHTHMKRQHNAFRSMLQDKRRTLALQQQVLQFIDS